MDFFERQRQARTDSRRLVALFVAAVVGIVLVIEAALLAVLHGQAMQRPRGQQAWTATAAEHAGLLLLVAAVVLGVIFIGSLVRAAQLREGGAAVARSLGGTQIPPSSRDLAHQRLRNVVEEVAIASGVPVPQVFVLEKESGINAFAAGFSTADAAIAVTRGALDTLDRDELQGVIAHEFSHVLNGDMRLNLRLVGWLAGITVLSMIGRILMRARGRNAGGVVMAGVVLAVVGSVGLFCARMIKAAISRQREYLADASAVQFTRQTRGIADALKAIAASSQGSRLSATDGEEVSHLLFGDGVGYSRLFATHPPLEQRIQALEPRFRMAELKDWARQRTVLRAAAGERERAAAAEAASRSRSGAPLGVLGDALPLPVVLAGLAPGASTALEPKHVVGQVANPGSEDIDTAHLLHEAIPPALEDAAHDPDRSVAVIAGLLIAADAATRERRLGAIQRLFGLDTGSAALVQAQRIAALHPMQHLPLAEIAFASLRRLPAADMRKAAELVDLLIAADGAVALFEFCLGHLLRQHIREALDPTAVRLSGRRSLKDVEAEAGLLLSLLARGGGADAARAFAAGVAELGQAVTPRFAVPADWPQRLDAALDALDRLKPAAKSMLVAAMTRTVMHDGRVDVAEAELLRTACAALHCPLPPLLHQARTRLAGPPTVE